MVNDERFIYVFFFSTPVQKNIETSQKNMWLKKEFTLYIRYDTVEPVPRLLRVVRMFIIRCLVLIKSHKIRRKGGPGRQNVYTAVDIHATTTYIFPRTKRTRRQENTFSFVMFLNYIRCTPTCFVENKSVENIIDSKEKTVFLKRFL